MMSAAASLLARGNALALFPEGTSHSDAGLLRFRSGAARIALSARALGSEPVRIVPAALYYEKKQTFRSRAVLALGAPLEVPLAPLDQAGEPPMEQGQKLTQDLREAIEQIMPTAETADALVLAESAERILSAALRDSPEACEEAARLLLPSGADTTRLSLAGRMARRRRLLDKYSELAKKSPLEVERLIENIRRLGNDLKSIGLPVDAAPGTPRPALEQLLLYVWGITLVPLAIAGWLLHAPAYQLVHFIAFRYSEGQTDITATVKLLAGILFFPLTWIVFGAAVGLLFNGPFGWVAFTSGPLLGWSAMSASEIATAVTLPSRIERRARKAGLKWPEIVARRAEVAQEMARLVSMT